MGSYAFTYLRPGESGTITPSKNLFIFNPVNLTFSNLADNQTADFIATTSATTYTIGGRVTNSGVGTSGIIMTLGGSLSNVTQTDANGNYSFTQLVGSGNYTVTPSQTGYNLTYTFTPPSRSYANLSANQVADFSFITSTALSVNAIADAYVQDGTLANTNFGNVTPLLVKSDNQAGQRRDIYFKYDLSAVNRNITNAKLRIYAGLSASGSINTSAYSVSDILWSEGGITWNNKPARNSTALAGATVAVTSTTYASYDIDITSYAVGEKAAGRDIFSVALHNPSNSTPYILLNSREASTNKPQLVITTSGSNNSPPTISLTAPANGATYPAPANITATATANDIDGTVSKVDFYAGTSLIGTDATAPYSVQWSSVNAGAYAITAIATDNSGSSTASSAANVSVNLPNNLPVVSVTAPVGGLTVPAGLTLSLSANATDIDGSITKVDFYAGASLLGTDTTAPYGVTWAAIAGAQTLTAVATDNAGATAPSAPVNISVVWQTGVTVVFDAYVRDGSSASTNFGTATELQTQQATGSNRESYLRFDLTNVNAVAKAKLRVYGKLSDASGSNVPVGVYSVASTNWIESGSGSITWNNKPPTGASILSTTTVTDTVSRWYEFDVTSWVQPERDAGHTLISLALKSLASSGPYASFVSREPTNNRPQLLLWTRQQRLALLVVGSANLNAGDNAAKIRLENLGFTVTVKVANNNLVTGDADGKAVVVISSTVNDGSVNTKFRYVAVPVVSWESAVLDDLAMTAATSGNFGATTVAQTNVNIVSPAHPMAAGLSGSVPVTSPGTNFSWGIPNVTAVTIAALIGEPTKFVIFGYESGATMFSLDAPARRVALFMTDVTAGNFGTTNGGPLFDAAIRWATEVVTAATLSSLSPISGPVSTVVSINGFNFGNTQSTSTLTFNGVAATPTSWTDKNIVASVPAFSTTGAVVVTVNGVASNGLTFLVGDVDSDADGLADWWELQYFGNLSQSGNADPDNDGLTNLQEYQQGRNPTKTSQADDGTGVDLRVHTPFMPPNL
jgi:hypothetical protein